MTNRVQKTFTVHLTSKSVYGSNSTYYFRTEAEARRKYFELKKWFENVPTQRVHMDSHEITVS